MSWRGASFRSRPNWSHYMPGRAPSGNVGSGPRPMPRRSTPCCGKNANPAIEAMELLSQVQDKFSNGFLATR